MKLRIWFPIVLLGLGLTPRGLTVAQEILPAPHIAVIEPLNYDSELHENFGQSTASVHTHEVHVPGASSLRLLFSFINLGESDALRISSPLNGEVHVLNAIERRKWENTSGYFNGDRLIIDMILAPGSKGSFAMSEILVGRGPSQNDTICGTDDRIASTDFRSMRFSTLSNGVAASAGCTIWLASNTDCALSAGHCFSGGTLRVAETMCPLSTSGGSVQHPPIQFQFTVVTTTITFANGGLGNDWGVCLLNPNNLGQSASALFGSFNVAPTLPTAGQVIRITGYGTDSGTANQTLQTHSGPAVAPTGTQLRYATDTTGGNSGSPVIDEATGNAIGIHTHGGCSATGGSNSGTSASHAAFQAAFTALCPSGPPPPPLYQVNQPASSLLLDGVVGSPNAPAITTRCLNASSSLALSGLPANVGLPYEVGISFLPLVPRNGGATLVSSTQLLNLDLANLIFLSTLGPVPALPAWPGNFNLAIPTATTGTLSFQMLAISPLHPDGFAMSQGCQLNVSSSGGVWPSGPVSDDSIVTVPLGGSTCLASLPFFGVNYTSFVVGSNGRVFFGTGSTDFTPSLAEALTGSPFIGFWTDLNPATGGSIGIASTALGEVTIAWNAVPYFGTSIANSFAIILDSNTGSVTLDGLQAIGTNPGTSTGDNQFLGLSRGNTGATDLGSTLFAPGASGAAINAGQMLYDFYLATTATGKAASLLPGTLSRITFTPLANTNYAWQGY